MPYVVIYLHSKQVLFLFLFKIVFRKKNLQDQLAFQLQNCSPLSFSSVRHAISPLQCVLAPEIPCSPPGRLSLLIEPSLTLMSLPCLKLSFWICLMTIALLFGYILWLHHATPRLATLHHTAPHHKVTQPFTAHHTTPQTPHCTTSHHNAPLGYVTIKYCIIEGQFMDWEGWWILVCIWDGKGKCMSTCPEEPQGVATQVTRYLAYALSDWLIDQKREEWNHGTVWR